MDMQLVIIVIYETVASLYNPGHFTVFEEAYPILYQALLVNILVVTMIINFVLFLYGMCGHTLRKKGYAIFVFAYHFIIVIPFFLSGIYLYLTAIQPGASNLSRSTINVFTKIIDELSFGTLTEPSLTAVTHLQERFCCCGLTSPADYGKQFEEEGGWNASRTHDDLTLSCPDETICEHEKFEGCSTKIPHRKRHFILVSSVIGLLCGLTALIITPWIYAAFEYDRRLARTKYIRAWRIQLDEELWRERKDDDSDDDSLREKHEKRRSAGHLSGPKTNFLKCGTLILEPVDLKAADEMTPERDEMDLSIKTEMKKGAVSKPSPEGSDTSQRAGLLPADKSAHPAGTEKTGCHSTYVPANSRATSALKNTEHFNPETQPLLEKNRGFPSAAQPRAGSKESSSPQSLAEMKRSLVTPPSNKQSHLVAGGIEDTRSVELF